MVRYMCCLPLLVATLSAGAQPTADSLVLAPDRVGPVTSTSAAEGLAGIYGHVAVVEDMIYLGEGYQERETVVFPSDSTRTLYITWKDTTHARNPALVQVRGDVWHTVEGIKLGTTLKTLERLNGGPFTLTGFDWDYAGTIVSWDRGELERLSQPYGRVLLRLQPEGHRYDRSVSGDRDIKSDHPEMQRLNPVVKSIWVEFY